MFETMFGSEMPFAARFLIAFLVVIGQIGVTAWLVRRFGASRLGGGGTRGRQPRLAVIDAATVDARRRLILIRRDNVEHLLIIGGPTDVVVEQNIVRAVGAREAPRAGLTEVAARNASAAETGWPLQPVTEPPPPPPTSPQRGYRPAPTDEPWLPPEPGARPRPTDSITGMASEFSTRVNAPEVAPPPARPEPTPAAPPAPAAKNIDQNLVEMAQQLEAALRRAPQPEHRPPVTDPLAMPAEPKVEARIQPKVEPKFEPKAEPKVEPKIDLKIEPKADPRFEQKFEPKIESKTEPKVQFKPQPKLDQPSPAPKIEPLKAEPAVDKALYDNLEEEMASLLGRPSGKT
jgi:flagellar biogenesis protein FliO